MYRRVPCSCCVAVGSLVRLHRSPLYSDLTETQANEVPGRALLEHIDAQKDTIAKSKGCRPRVAHDNTSKGDGGPVRRPASAAGIAKPGRCLPEDSFAPLAPGRAR